MVIILAILVVAGIGFGIWMAISGNQKPAENPPVTPVEPSEEEEEPSEDEPITEEVELTDANIIKELDEKIAVLHGGYNLKNLTAPTIVIAHGLHQEIPLYIDGNLSNAAKLANIALALQNSNLATSVTPSIASSIASNFPDLSFTYNTSLETTQQMLEGNIFAKDVFESKYHDVFGGELVYENSRYCPQVYYDDSGYYFMDYACGGTDPSTTYFYKNRYTTDGDNVYVYINAGLIDEKNKIHCDVDTNEESICGTLEDDTTDFTIDSTNYNQFAEYRFTFKKADNGTYYFDKVEKIEKTND